MSAHIRLSDEQAGRGAYESAILARYAEARQRLRGTPPKPVRALGWTINPTQQSTYSPPYGAPLNMLATPGWRFLVALVAARHKLAAHDILGRFQDVYSVAARHEAIWLIFNHCDLSGKAIGRLFGRDHSTVHHALQKFRKSPDRKLPERMNTPPRRSIDMLGKPGWQFIAQYVALKRGLHPEDVKFDRPRTEAIRLMHTHCEYVRSARIAGALLTNWEPTP